MKYFVSTTSLAAAFPFFSASRRMIADSCIILFYNLVNHELHYKNYKQLFNEVKLPNLFKGW